MTTLPPLARRLYLLSSRETDRNLLLAFARRYYGNASYDVVPTLCAAMGWAHGGEHGLEGRVLLAAVIHDLSLYLVSTVEGEAYVLRSDVVSVPLSQHPTHHDVALSTLEGEHVLQLLSTRTRLIGE
jgi:hypothetical protein